MAINIRENCGCSKRMNSKNIEISDLPNSKGIKILVKSSCDGESVFVPSFVCEGGIKDVVYNDFYVERGAKVKIYAGCAIHTSNNKESSHNGIHRFFINEGATVEYFEKHFGHGSDANHIISPSTEIHLEKDASLYIDSVQYEGVSFTKRVTKGNLKENSYLDVKEKILTQKDQEALTYFNIDMVGKDSKANIVSRSVVRDNSKQRLESNITATAQCSGHSECDAILAENGEAIAIPALISKNPKASLVHEAAIGRISKKQIEKLQTLGLSEEDAESYIIKGFLK